MKQGVSPRGLCQGILILNHDYHDLSRYSHDHDYHDLSWYSHDHDYHDLSRCSHGHDYHDLYVMEMPVCDKKNFIFFYV